MSFVLFTGLIFGLAGVQPSQAGSRSFLGGAIVGGIGVMMLNSAARSNTRRRAPRRHKRVRRYNPAAASEPRMNRTTKRDVQDALNRRNFNVGYPDGSFGRNTRRGIRNFQTSIAVAVTGYLTAHQLDILLGRATATLNGPPAYVPENNGPAATTNYGQPLPAAPAQPFGEPLRSADATNGLSNGSSSPQPMVVSSRGYTPASRSTSAGYLEDAPQ